MFHPLLICVALGALGVLAILGARVHRRKLRKVEIAIVSAMLLLNIYLFQGFGHIDLFYNVHYALGYAVQAVFFLGAGVSLIQLAALIFLLLVPAPLQPPGPPEPWPRP